jgi:hypothetical protein
MEGAFRSLLIFAAALGAGAALASAHARPGEFQARYGTRPAAENHG